MTRRFLPVDRDQPALLPLNMYDWVPKDHVVWLVIDTVEQLVTPKLAVLLAGGERRRARGRRAYDPALLAYAYCCGVLSTRAIEARCRVDATFRLVCAGLGRLSVVAGDGVKIGANAPEEANRTEAGLRKLAAAIVAAAAGADEPAPPAMPATPCTPP